MTSLESKAAHLCTSIEPIMRDVMCEREMGHPMPHQAHYAADDGTVLIEWQDPGRVLDYLKQLQREVQ